MLRASSTSSESAMLPLGFEPSSAHVICNRGKESLDHAGNQRFREIIEELADGYCMDRSRAGKFQYVSEVIHRVSQSCTGYAGGRNDFGFVKRDLTARRWLTVTISEARKKISQAFRDSKSRKNNERKRESISSEAAPLSIRPIAAQENSSVSGPIQIPSFQLPANAAHLPDRLVNARDDRFENEIPSVSTSLEYIVSSNNLEHRQECRELSDAAWVAAQDVYQQDPTHSRGQKRRRHSLLTGTDDLENNPLPDDFDIDSIFSGTETTTSTFPRHISSSGSYKSKIDQKTTTYTSAQDVIDCTKTSAMSQNPSAEREKEDAKMTIDAGFPW